MTFGGSAWFCARVASSKGTVSSVPTRFRAKSGTHTFKQGTLPQVDLRLDNSVATVLARNARGPGFGLCPFSCSVTHVCQLTHCMSIDWYSQLVCFMFDFTFKLLIAFGRGAVLHPEETYIFDKARVNLFWYAV